MFSALLSFTATSLKWNRTLDLYHNGTFYSQVKLKIECNKLEVFQCESQLYLRSEGQIVSVWHMIKIGYLGSRCWGTKKII